MAGTTVQQKGLWVLLHWTRAVSAFLSRENHTKPTLPISPASLKSNMTSTEVAAIDLRVVLLKEFLPLSEHSCSLCSWSCKRTGFA